MYLVAYQPIVFNDSVMPFTPYKDDSSKADITGNQIKVTKDNVKESLTF